MKWKMTAAMVVAISAMLLGGSSIQASAKTVTAIRFFVIQSQGLFEVITGSRGGGLFIRQNRGHLGNTPIIGYTDRATRGDRVVTQVLGNGVADRAGVEFNGRVAAQTLFPVGLPFMITQPVSPNANTDNITAFVQQGRVRSTRRLPLGTRPRM